MIENGEKLWLVLIIQIIRKRNDSANIILLCTIHDHLYVLFNLSPLRSANIVRLLVNDWRNSFKNKKYLYSPSFCIHKSFVEKAI